MRQVGIALALGAVLTACGSGTGPPTSAPDSQSASPRAFEGSGDLVTEAFALDGGSYSIEWTATSLPGYPCDHEVSLWNDTGYSDLVLDLWFGADEPIYDTAYRNGLPPGTYHFEVKSACDWTLVIAESEVESPAW